MIEYIYAYLMSRKHIRWVMQIAGKNPAKTLLVFLLAVLVVSVPAKHTLVVQNYAYNIGLIGSSVIIITGIIAVMAKYLFGKPFVQHMLGLVHIASSAFIINSAVLVMLYAIGMPLNASEMLWAVAATMISTYYFIVLMAVSSTATIQSKSKMKYVVEVASLILWFGFTFYILALTA